MLDIPGGRPCAYCGCDLPEEYTVIGCDLCNRVFCWVCREKYVGRTKQKHSWHGRKVYLDICSFCHPNYLTQQVKLDAF